MGERIPHARPSRLQIKHNHQQSIEATGLTTSEGSGDSKYDVCLKLLIPPHTDDGS